MTSPARLNIISNMTADPKTAGKPCSIALSAAQAAQTAVTPDQVILFGSRARGDYRPDSDIDLLVITPREPSPDRKAVLAATVGPTAHDAHGQAIDIQLVWRSQQEFRHNRRYTNSVETHAIREGILMPGNPEESSSSYDDEETEYEYSWTNYDNRLYHAEWNLKAITDLDKLGYADIIIGQHSQSALEHAMKALLEAHEQGHGVGYGNTHDIGQLLGNIRRLIPELADYRLSIEPDIYSEYAGRREYSGHRRNPTLTDQPDYRKRTTADIEFILNLARTARARNQQSVQ